MKHADLIARLEKLTGPDREVDYAIFRLFAEKEHSSIWDPKQGHQYTASIDAAVALGERLLPGQAWHLMTAALKAWSLRDRKAPDFPRFYLITLLRALSSRPPT